MLVQRGSSDLGLFSPELCMYFTCKTLKGAAQIYCIKSVIFSVSAAVNYKSIPLENVA